MGYCTQIDRITGRRVLVCDSCGRTGGARKRRCPFGYCPAPPLCQECHRKEQWGHKATHRAQGCEVAHIEFEAARQRELDLIAAGHMVRCAALIAGIPTEPDRVHVLFRVQDCCGVETTVGRYMPRSVYNTHPLLDVRTLADYETTHGGPLPEAPPEF